MTPNSSFAQMQIYRSNNMSGQNRVSNGEELTNEKIWQLPLWSEYNKYLNSTVADIKNTGNASSGAILGGIFLSNFIPK